MWKSVALVAGLGGMFGAILAVAGRKLAVHTDARIEEITNLLPGANCGSDRKSTRLNSSHTRPSRMPSSA